MLNWKNGILQQADAAAAHAWSGIERQTTNRGGTTVAAAAAAAGAAAAAASLCMQHMCKTQTQTQHDSAVRYDQIPAIK